MLKYSGSKIPRVVILLLIVSGSNFVQLISTLFLFGRCYSSLYPNTSWTFLSLVQQAWLYQGTRHQRNFSSPEFLFNISPESSEGTLSDQWPKGAAKRTVSWGETIQMWSTPKLGSTVAWPFRGASLPRPSDWGLGGTKENQAEDYQCATEKTQGWFSWSS